ncbi:MAG: hypothetical protein ABSF92_11085, partial [Candidatus Acidiferrales bacterium]
MIPLLKRAKSGMVTALPPNRTRGKPARLSRHLTRPLRLNHTNSTTVSWSGYELFWMAQTLLPVRFITSWGYWFSLGGLHWITSGLATRTKPLARRTLRVGRAERCGVADVVWVTEKGDSCDPFTQNDA